MAAETNFKLDNPPNFDQSKLFSIDALVGVAVQGTQVDFYTIVHRLPFGNYPKGGIFVIGEELGLPYDARLERYGEFERKACELSNGIIVKRPEKHVACENIIIPDIALTIHGILQNIKKYESLDKVFEIIPGYRNKK